ncbi:site-specific integrase [Nocardia sp. X0981]
MAANSIGVLCAAIARAHQDSGLADPTADPAVRAVMAELRAVHVPQQTPAATLRVVARMVETAQTTALTWKEQVAARRDIALLCLGFAAALRRSEIAALVVGDLVVEAGLAGEPLLRLRIRRHERARAENAYAYIPRGRNDGLRCPWCAVARWLDIVAVCDGAAAVERRRQQQASIMDPPAVEDAVAVSVQRFARTDTAAAHSHRCDGAWPDAVDTAAPLFRPVDHGGAPRPAPLSDRSVGHILEKRSRAAGVEVMRAHSLRAGTAAEAFDRGATVEEVQALGRWKNSATALRYDSSHVPRSTRVDLGL